MKFRTPVARPMGSVEGSERINYQSPGINAGGSRGIVASLKPSLEVRGLVGVFEDVSEEAVADRERTGGSQRKVEAYFSDELCRQ